ncbi:type II secretion system secretin GspD [Novosphingobium huizhouense]|uniref:type II secretion system secretin GspD n=1 Tax=Novosphingobium huizhouense TaxID=2866625 RepID=UPI001CD81DE9|nr:type II secretion system secretin GspD [Novosphingobium huizhouense]
MTSKPPILTVAFTLALLIAQQSATAAAPAGEVQPVERAKPLPPAPAPAARIDGVETTIVGGEAPPPTAPRSPTRQPPKGNIEFNIPSADVRTLARIVLGDTLGIPYSVSVDGDVDVGLSTPGPVNRTQLLELFEASLKKANLAMVWQGSGYRIMTVAQASAEGTSFLPDRGFGTETIVLQFANAAELRKLMDSVVPGAVQQVDEGRNALVLAGTAAQRKAAHEIIAQFDVNWLRSMSFALYVPQRTDSRLIVPELERLINAPDAPTRGMVRLIGMDKLNGVIAISAQRQYLEDVRRWVEVLDREGTNNEPRLFVYRVQNGRAKDLVKTLNSTFGFGGGGSGDSDGSDVQGGDGVNRTQSRGDGIDAPAPGQNVTGPRRPVGLAGNDGGSGNPSQLRVRVSSDDINNAVVIYGSNHDYSIVEDALRRLDVAPMQVMIEAAITEVGLNDDLRYGVQWNFQAGDSNFALTKSTDSVDPTRIVPGFSYFYSNNNDISATLNALESRTNVRVVSAPKLLVLNNQTAALQVGDQVPVQTQSSQSTIGSNAPVVNAIEYRDTGVILKITPRVNASGSVLLDVAQEVSDVNSTKTSDIDSPTISTRKISTTVAVQDGQVIALGGLFRNSQSFDKSGLPILSRIPVLGSLLFGSTSNTQRRTELIVLIKPHVLRSPDDLSAITEEMRAKISTLEPFKTKGRIP